MLMKKSSLSNSTKMTFLSTTQRKKKFADALATLASMINIPEGKSAQS